MPDGHHHELLSEYGWSVQLDTSEDDDEDEKTFYKRDFEKKFFSHATNEAFVRTFLANAKRDPLTGEIGKTIMFAVSRHHARKLTELLNVEIEKLHPGKYQSDFAVQVTSNIPHAQDMTKKFDSERNALNGKTRFRSDFTDYHSSRTRVCVTVGMMTTGYDCEDLLNVVLAARFSRPLISFKSKGAARGFTFSSTNRMGRKSKPRRTISISSTSSPTASTSRRISIMVKRSSRQKLAAVVGVEAAGNSQPTSLGPAG